MLPFEILQKICQNLSFLDVNRFAEAVDLDKTVDKRIIDKKSGFLVCPICFHGQIDKIVENIFGFNSESPEYKGMR